MFYSISKKKMKHHLCPAAHFKVPFMEGRERYPRLFELDFCHSNSLVGIFS